MVARSAEGIIGGAFAILFRHKLAFLATAAPAILVQLFTLAAGDSAGRPPMPAMNAAMLAAGPAAIGIVVFLAVLAMLILAKAAAYGVALEAALDGKVGAGRAYRLALHRFWPMLGTALLVAVAVVVGFVLFIVPGVFLMIRYILAMPATLFESTGPSESMARSARYVAGHGWRIFGILLVVVILMALIAAGLRLAEVVLGGTHAGEVSAIGPIFLFRAFAAWIGQLPIIVVVLLYLDLQGGGAGPLRADPP